MPLHRLSSLEYCVDTFTGANTFVVLRVYGSNQANEVGGASSTSDGCYTLDLSTLGYQDAYQASFQVGGDTTGTVRFRSVQTVWSDLPQL